MNGFRVDSERLHAQAGEFGELAGQAQRIADDLRHAVESAGPCWGSDEIGQRFAGAHQRQAAQALDGLTALSGELKGMGTKFAETAATHQQVDQANAGGLERTAGQG